MTIRELFLEKDYNCAETLLLWANQRYGLNVSSEDARLVSGFGGGSGADWSRSAELFANGCSGFTLRLS